MENSAERILNDFVGYCKMFNIMNPTQDDVKGFVIWKGFQITASNNNLKIICDECLSADSKFYHVVCHECYVKLEDI